MNNYGLLVYKGFGLGRERITIGAEDKDTAFDNLQIHGHVINYNDIANMNNENDILRAKIYQFGELQFKILNNQIIVLLFKKNEVIDMQSIKLLSNDRGIINDKNMQKINKIRSNYNERMDTIVYKGYDNYMDNKQHKLRNYIIKDI